MERLLDAVRNVVRIPLRLVARLLNTLSRGKISPTSITIIGFLAHIPIAWLIATAHPLKAAGLLVVFGLFDALDGELARLQNKTSDKGMFLDSVTDRLKEIMLYVAVAYLFIENTYYASSPDVAVWAAAACGLAVAVSYINAWGEVMLAKQSQAAAHQANKLLRLGLSFDLRIFLLVIGLLFAVLPEVLVIITVLSALTVVYRMSVVLRRLGHVPS